ncbi:MAG: helix-turn-helix domain-containing protein [Chitinophagaceae bacterium]
MKYSRNNEVIILFGKRIKALRKAKKLSQEALALNCGLEYSQISRIERGIINTSISQAATIATALQVELKDLFEFETLPKK